MNKKLGVITGNAAMRVVRTQRAHDNHSLTHLPMRTSKSPGQLALRDTARQMEYDCAPKMTRALSSVPVPLKSTLYGVRAHKANRLAGRLPEMCLTLVDAGAPLSDVLAFPRAIEQACIERRVAQFGITLEQALAEETHAEHEMNVAQLHLAAHPNDLRCRDRVIEAAHTQEIATATVRAVIATMTRTPEPPRAA